MTKQAEREADTDYLAFIRELPCCAPSVTECQSPPPQHPHHSTGAGMGMKASDRETMPLCWMHHRQFHEGKGPFDGWTRDERRLFQEQQVERCLAAYAVFEGNDTP